MYVYKQVNSKKVEDIEKYASEQAGQGWGYCKWSRPRTDTPAYFPSRRQLSPPPAR